MTAANPMGGAAPVRFLLGRETVTLADIDPTTTLLEFLRGRADRKGTKEGCAEGDCGACTVAVGEPADGRMRYRAVNACIQFVGALHGKQVLTVEDLQGADGALHPVQAAMVAQHGSQCGFCTPGFVMSLFVAFADGTRLGRGAIGDTLAGNLCRCTGYGPILAAAEAMFDLPAPDDSGRTPDAAQMRALAEMAAEPLVGLSRGGRRLLAPASADGLAALLDAEPDATLLAGGTDVGLWVTKQLRRPQTVIHTGRAADLARIAVTDDAIVIGAAARLADVAPAIAADYPAFGEIFRRYGSVQVRNAGTLGGNVANGSPIGDGPPGLIALGAELVLRRGAARRRIALEDFFIDYGKQDRHPAEFVEQIVLPRPRGGSLFRMYKISKRFDQDISAVCGAFAIGLADGVVTSARVAFGGMAGTPRRAHACEAALAGRPWTEAGIADALAALDRDYEPLTDMRASAWYRREAARALLLRACQDSGDGGPQSVLACEAA
ncbi:MAG: xanthine dehydrogenase small subunit [Alphaproteobacteria bacterium]